MQDWGVVRKGAGEGEGAGCTCQAGKGFKD